MEYLAGKKEKGDMIEVFKILNGVDKVALHRVQSSVL